MEDCNKENIIPTHPNPCAVSNSKFADILHYLDEVERDDDGKSVAASSCVAQSQCGSVLAEAVVGSMNSKIAQLKAKLLEKQQAVNLLKRKISEYKTRELNYNSETQLKLQKQKEEFDVAANRNMDFIKTLLLDKESLNKRIELLSLELKQLEEKHQRKIEEVEERHASILSSQKIQWEKLEKRRRAVWIEEQSKKIKENALKALEPEIATLLCKHRQEKQRWEDEKDEELRRRDAILAQKERELTESKRWLMLEKEEELRRKESSLASKDQELIEQRTRLTRDYDQSLLRERDVFHQQNKELTERYERQLTELRQQLRCSKEQEEEIRLRLEQETLKEKSKVNIENSSKLTAAEKEIRTAIEAEYREKELQYRRSTEQAQADWREKLKAERDAEIALVIEKVEDSVLQLRKEKQQLDTCWQEKYNTLQRERDNLSLKAQDYQAQLATTAAELRETQRLLHATEEQLQRSLEQVAQSSKAAEAELKQKLLATEEHCKASFAGKLQEQTEAISTLQDRLTQAQQKAKVEVSKQEELAKQHTRELEQLQVRFQQALSKKDRALGDMQAALQTSQDRVLQIERLLRKQELVRESSSNLDEDL